MAWARWIWIDTFLAGHSHPFCALFGGFMAKPRRTLVFRKGRWATAHWAIVFEDWLC